MVALLCYLDCVLGKHPYLREPHYAGLYISKSVLYGSMLWGDNRSSIKF